MKETKDWCFYNNMIYKIYTTEDCYKMRFEFLEQLKIVVDFDSAEFVIGDVDKNLEIKICSPIGYNCSVCNFEYYNETGYRKDIFSSGRSIVYRDTDVLTNAERIETEIYKKVYLPNSWNYSLQVVLARNSKFYGCITLYRNKGKDDFSNEDILILDMLKDHISFRIQEQIKKTSSENKKMSLEQLGEIYKLTKREKEIVKELVNGKSNLEISDELFISPFTFKKHLNNIYKKMGINHKSQLLTQIMTE